ncbi:MAG TPA: YaaR family protein [Clostridia bacterium]|jgi:uncharacterized protein YaaR (DUF327 family)|nr:YaaR family protein [Clostridia bacterium]
MRIRNKKTERGLWAAGEKTVAKNKAVAAAQHSFKNILQEESSLYWQERLQLLLENLDQLGQRLLKTFSIEDLLVYKQLLSSFLDEAVGQMYVVKKETGWLPSGRRKLYQRVELLNQEVEKLTQLILDEQKDSVQLVAKLDTIRGLLVDLYS